jgi:hypothetical protein
MNQELAIHVACEVAVIVAVTLYFNRRISRLESERSSNSSNCSPEKFAQYDLFSEEVKQEIDRLRYRVSKLEERIRNQKSPRNKEIMEARLVETNVINELQELQELNEQSDPSENKIELIEDSKEKKCSNGVCKIEKDIPVEPQKDNLIEPQKDIPLEPLQEPQKDIPAVETIEIQQQPQPISEDTMIQNIQNIAKPVDISQMKKNKKTKKGKE